MHDSNTHNIPGEIQTHHDRIPIYGHLHTICAVQSGPWSDPATWDEGRVPVVTDAVCIPVGLTVTMGAPASTLESRVADLERRVTALESGVPSSSPAVASECLDLVIAGTLDTVPGFDLTVRTITVLPGGHLQLSQRGIITYRDGTIDTTFDPHQFGHGLLVIDGTLTIAGEAKTPWSTLAAEIHAGGTTLQLASAPDGWLPGDRLVLPDTRQPVALADLLDSERYIEHAIVESVSGATVTLTAPVQYDHFGWRTQAGVCELFPDVGNLTRAIVFASENPAGTRAHVLLTGRSDITARNVELRELGRTTVAPLNSTTRDSAGTVTHVGTNQIGRYPWHFHHCLGPAAPTKPVQFEATGIAISGSPKWGIAIHGSHHGKVDWNVVDGAKGAGIVTETVSEYATLIESNLLIGRRGSGQRITARSHRNDPLGDFWHGGVGLGLTSATCAIRLNHIYDYQDGIGMAGFRTTTAKWPTVPGADPEESSQPRWSTVFQPHPFYYPFLFPTDGNQVWGCCRGIETWTADAFPDKLDFFPGLTFVHCHHGTDLEDQLETTTKGWRWRGDFSLLNDEVPSSEAGVESRAAIALFFKGSYEFGHTHFDMDVRGYDVGYRMVMPSNYSRFIRCTFECPTIVYQPNGHMSRHGFPWTGTWEDCTFLPVNGAPPTFIDGSPHYDIDLWLQLGRPDFRFLIPMRYELRPWLDGRNLDVYHHFQSQTFTRQPPITAPDAYGDFPPGVNTHAELITLGTPIFGAVMPATAEPFGPPRFFAVEAAP